MKKDLAKLFGAFAGREILVRELSDSVTKKTLYVEQLSQPEPVFEEMKKVAEDNGLSLRVHFPGQRATRDCQPNRVNVHIEKNAQGHWQVANSFKLG